MVTKNYWFSTKQLLSNNLLNKYCINFHIPTRYVVIPEKGICQYTECGEAGSPSSNFDDFVFVGKAESEW